jgi:hypothetical protein
MKIRVLLVSTLLTLLCTHSSTSANAEDIYVTPQLVSFTFSPGEVDLTGPSTKVDFELAVYHPIGIQSSRVKVDLLSAKNNSLSLNLIRTDIPTNLNLKNVVFKGSIEIPRNVRNEPYVVTAESIMGLQPPGGSIAPMSPKFVISKNINKVVGAERDLIIRSSGNMDFNFKTFIGPSHPTTFILQREYPNLPEYKTPIWKVGEFYIPSDYYELKVPDLNLMVATKDDGVCISDGKKLKFIKEGDCYFTVSTEKTKNYNYKEDRQLVVVTKARIAQVLSVESTSDQKATNLPKQIKIARVYSFSQGYINPKTLTPEVCLASDGFVNIFSGGFCKYSYQASETNEFLASKIYELSFEVIKNLQTIVFSLPSTIDISSKRIGLLAIASSGGTVTFDATPAGICSITGSTLNLLKSGNCSVTATQAGTSTLAPVSAIANIKLTGTTVVAKKTITCIKGKTNKKVTGTNPKCPAGYKAKSNSQN